MKDFLDQVHSLFEKAIQNKGCIDYNHIIGGFRIRLRFAGSALPSLILPALAHLATSSKLTPDLTILLWDSLSTGTKAPYLPLKGGETLRRGEIFDGSRINSFRVAIDANPNILKTLDYDQKIGLFWIRDANQMPPYHRAAPILQILLWWLERHHLCLLHAGAVGDEHGCVLLAGQGGSGKSSTALTSLYAGMKYLSDDFCLLSLQPEPKVFSLYNSGKLWPDSKNRLHHVYSEMVNPVFQDQGKAIYFLSQTHPSRIAITAPIRAILLPRVVNTTETRITPSTPAEGLNILAPSSLNIGASLGCDVRLAFTNMARLTKMVPSYTLHLGTDIAQIPKVISELLEKEA